MTEAETQVERVSNEMPWVEIDDQLFAELLNIPRKLSFKISDAASIVGVETFVLRYWESEFPSFRPSKAPNNQRIYSQKDVELALVIKKLLKRDKFSIEGAKRVLGKLRSESKKIVDFTERSMKERKGLEKGLSSLLVSIRQMKSKFSV